MKIRSITSFYDPGLPGAVQTLKTLAAFSKELSVQIEDLGYPVQSTRLATPPFPIIFSRQSNIEILSKTKALESQSAEYGWAYLSLGPALPEYPGSYEIIPTLLAETKNVFFGGVVSKSGIVYPQAVAACSRVITKAATITVDGFTNLRFAALANVSPNTPFLPAAYHKPGKPPAVSIAMECADVVLQVFQQAGELEEKRKELIRIFENAASQIDNVCDEVCGKNGIEFLGFDFSPAPFPEDWCSLGGAIEALGLETIGSAGSLAAAAIIAETLDRGTWLRTGFNGLMLPVLEDSVLARRAAEGKLTIRDLLLYSAVCGTGLDTIPLSGDCSETDINGLLIDIAALAVRLGKPLTARLMPIPGKIAGDPTKFQFDFFANSRVMTLDAQKLSSPLLGDIPIPISTRIH